MADRAVPAPVADAPSALGTLGRRARGLTGIGVRPGARGRSHGSRSTRDARHRRRRDDPRLERGRRARAVGVLARGLRGVRPRLLRRARHVRLAPSLRAARGSPGRPHRDLAGGDGRALPARADLGAARPFRAGDPDLGVRDRRTSPPAASRSTGRGRRPTGTASRCDRRSSSAPARSAASPRSGCSRIRSSASSRSASSTRTRWPTRTTRCRFPCSGRAGTSTGWPPSTTSSR